LFQKDLVGEALQQAVVKLNPKSMIRNPVMFTVEIGTILMLLVRLCILISPDNTKGSLRYHFTLLLFLILTLLFAHFAEDITEAGGDKSSVTGGTKVLSDKIKVIVTTQPGESFLDKMIALVEGASRQKTPNEIALTILLAGFTLVFVIVCVTLKPFADYANTPITIAAFISLFVCLIPTTIGGLLSAIGIAGMDRALRANVITKSGKAVETAGDLDTLLLDKTGTITIGNRKATNFWPADGIDNVAFTEACAVSSL